MTPDRLAEIRTHAAANRYSLEQVAQDLRGDGVDADRLVLQRHRDELLDEVDRLTAERDEHEQAAEEWRRRSDEKQAALEKARHECGRLAAEKYRYGAERDEAVQALDTTRAALGQCREERDRYQRWQDEDQAELRAQVDRLTAELDRWRAEAERQKANFAQETLRTSRMLAACRRDAVPRWCLGEALLGYWDAQERIAKAAQDPDAAEVSR